MKTKIEEGAAWTKKDSKKKKTIKEALFRITEKIKKNKDAVRQLISGQTPEEAKAQRSPEAANFNPDWVTPDDEKSPRQQDHDSRRGVKKNRIPNEDSEKKKAIKEALFGLMEGHWDGRGTTFGKGGSRAAANQKAAEVEAYNQRKDNVLRRGFADEDVKTMNTVRNSKLLSTRKRNPLPGAPGHKPVEVPEKEPELTLQQRAAKQIADAKRTKPEDKSKKNFENTFGPGGTREKRNKRRVERDRQAKPATPKPQSTPINDEPENTPNSDSVGVAAQRNIKRLLRSSDDNAAIDKYNAGTGPRPPKAVSPRFHGRRDDPTTRSGGRASDTTPPKSVPPRVGGNVEAVGRVARQRMAARASTEIVKNGRMALSEACWKGYKAKGMKKKGAKTVPNCVKEGRMALAEKVLSELIKEEKEFTKQEVAANTAPVKKASQARKRGEAKPRGPKVTTVRGTSEGPKGHSREKALGHSDAGKFDRKGRPAPNPMSRGADKSAKAKTSRKARATMDQINRSREDNPGKVFKTKSSKAKDYDADAEMKDLDMDSEN